MKILLSSFDFCGLLLILFSTAKLQNASKTDVSLAGKYVSNLGKVVSKRAF
jgi:hypothetical protein